LVAQTQQLNGFLVAAVGLQWNLTTILQEWIADLVAYIKSCFRVSGYSQADKIGHRYR
jgi:hypothetical protein